MRQAINIKFVFNIPSKSSYLSLYDSKQWETHYWGFFSAEISEEIS